MIRTYAYGIALAALVAAFVAVGWKAYRAGDTAATARYERALAAAREAAMRAAEEASRREAGRLAAERQRDELQRDLEDAARNDVNAARPALSIDSVRRLNRY